MKKINRIIALISAVIMLSAVMSISAFAEVRDLDSYTGKLGDSITYSFNRGTGILTVSGSGKTYDYSDNDGVPLSNNVVTEIVIGEGITYIGDYCFCSNSALKKINLPSTLTGIGKDAFSYSDLTSVTVPEGVTEIDGFNCCRELVSVTLPSTLKTIKNHAFSECDNLASVTIPEGVESIGEYAFYKCKKLQSVNIPKGVTAINKKAFCHCESLTSITFPDSLKEIGDSVFYECNNLGNVILPEGLERIGSYAFSECYKMTEINVPESVEVIDEGVFCNCENLSVINLPSQLRVLGEAAFAGCAIESVYVPDSVKGIRHALFNHCPNITEFTVPKNVRCIGSELFENCSSLKKIYIPLSVRFIGGYLVDTDAVVDIYYEGTEEQWGKISFGRYFRHKIPDSATIHYNSEVKNENTNPVPKTADLTKAATQKTSSAGSDGIFKTVNIAEAVITILAFFAGMVIRFKKNKIA